MDRISELVSVIIPCYNHGKFIREALKSIENQTYQNLEIIIVNDGSDDEYTLNVLENLDSRNVTIFHKENGDVSSARNYGISRCNGEFILTLDADDKFAPTFVEKGVEILKQQPKTGMVTCYVERFGGNRKETIDFKGGDIVDFLVKNNSVACLLYRYECWVEAGGYDEAIHGFEDWEFSISVTKHGWKVYSIPEYLFFYRIVSGSMYDRVCVHRADIVKYMVEKHRDVFHRHFEDVLYRKELEISEQRRLVRMYNDSLALKFRDLIHEKLSWFGTFISYFKKNRNGSSQNSESVSPSLQKKHSPVHESTLKHDYSFTVEKEK